ncbi:MAG: hypothetical protein IT160_09290 [Bryobacterales bacterium]|nr:hypothetical protein [Bryobacterales bacterium]
MVVADRSFQQLTRQIGHCHPPRYTNALSPARSVAFDTLLRVERGGYASDLLLKLTASLDTRDAGLATDLVFGVLRRRGQLDYLIQYWGGRMAAKFDTEVRIILEMGIYQIRYLERIPRHAAVSESVELVKRARKRSAAGLVNAILRKAGNDEIDFTNEPNRLSIPAWLLERWQSHYGADAARSLAEAALHPPDAYRRLTPAGARMQDIGAQSIVPLLALEPGQRFLDLCAAPGNKTAQALESGVHPVACDRYWFRMEMLRGLPCPLVQLDGVRPLPFGPVFDRILVDAPCSGTGTLGRNPEIKWRLRPQDLPRFAERQRALLSNALACLGPRGRLVYATCSLEPEENEEIVEPYHPKEVLRRMPGRDPGDGFFAAVITSE